MADAKAPVGLGIGMSTQQGSRKGSFGVCPPTSEQLAATKRRVAGPFPFTFERKAGCEEIVFYTAFSHKQTVPMPADVSSRLISIAKACNARWALASSELGPILAGHHGMLVMRMKDFDEKVFASNEQMNLRLYKPGPRNTNGLLIYESESQLKAANLKNPMDGLDSLNQSIVYRLVWYITKCHEYSGFSWDSYIPASVLPGSTADALGEADDASVADFVSYCCERCIAEHKANPNVLEGTGVPRFKPAGYEEMMNVVDSWYKMMDMFYSQNQAGKTTGSKSLDHINLVLLTLTMLFRSFRWRETRIKATEEAPSEAVSAGLDDVKEVEIQLEDPRDPIEIDEDAGPSTRRPTPKTPVPPGVSQQALADVKKAMKAVREKAPPPPPRTGFQLAVTGSDRHAVTGSTALGEAVAAMQQDSSAALIPAIGTMRITGAGTATQTFLDLFVAGPDPDNPDFIMQPGVVSDSPEDSSNPLAWLSYQDL